MSDWLATSTTGGPSDADAAVIQPLRHKDTKTEVAQSIPISDELNRVASAVVDSAFKVHRALGPGLLEAVYEICLQHELTIRGFKVQTQVHLPVVYEGIKIDAGFRLDMLVNGCLIVEIKAIEALADVHKAQLLTYLKLSGHRLGFLINFNAAMIKFGIKRIVL